jgi:hypothetical protein
LCYHLRAWRQTVQKESRRLGRDSSGRHATVQLALGVLGLLTGLLAWLLAGLLAAALLLARLLAGVLGLLLAGFVLILLVLLATHFGDLRC